MDTGYVLKFIKRNAFMFLSSYGLIKIVRNKRSISIVEKMGHGQMKCVFHSGDLSSLFG